MAAAPSRHSSQLLTAAVWAAGATLLTVSAARLGWAYLSKLRQESSKKHTLATAVEDEEEKLEAKPPSASVVQVTYATTPTMCFSVPSSSDPRPAVLAGPLLKMIDVVASICARKHSGTGCVTVSVDAVLFLRPIYLGELIHLSAAVNRAWTSSMEVGVKILKEDTEKGKLTYVSHSYLTFVAVQRSSFSSAEAPGTSAPPAKHKVRVPPVLPESPLELRRYRLAGRRRTRRMEIAKSVSDVSAGSGRWGVAPSVAKGLLHEVLALSSDLSSNPLQRTSQRTAQRQQAALDELELEFIVQGLLNGEEGLHVDKERGVVFVNTDEEEEHFERSLEDVLQAARRLSVNERMILQSAEDRGQGEQASSSSAVSKLLRRDSLSQDYSPENVPRAQKKRTSDGSRGAKRSLSPSWRRASTLSFVSETGSGRRDSHQGAPANASPQFLDSVSPGTLSQPFTFSPSNHNEARGSNNKSGTISAAETVTRSVALVFPDHTNSNGVLFGGQLMGWMEDVALMACRRLAGGKRFSIVALDGLEFKKAVEVGETLFFTAIVIRTFTQSAEVYVVAEATARGGKQRRLANQALFTAACSSTASVMTSPQTEQHQTGGFIGRHGGLLRVEMPAGSALSAFSQAADRRREERLAMRNMLLRLYAFDDD